MSDSECSDRSVPGGLYLCQVDECISCGACCGLYNVSDASRDALQKMLARRTEMFSRVAGQVDKILDFQQEIEQLESAARPFQALHHCMFLGLVGEKRSRVGCLLHPMHSGNNGIDFRGLSYYGGMACRVYFCPTYSDLPRWIKEILFVAFDNWYDYGLVISEPHMVGAFFFEVAHRLGRALTPTDFTGNKKALEAVQAFMSFKRCWPFRDNHEGALVNCYINDQQYKKPPVDYDAIGVADPKYDTIFRELSSQFNTLEDFHRAEKILENIFNRIVLSIEPGRRA
jgi:hypothetical protein